MAIDIAALGAMDAFQEMQREASCKHLMWQYCVKMTAMIIKHQQQWMQLRRRVNEYLSRELEICVTYTRMLQMNSV